jgi:negative regulator of flagellin synthesis FlgM
MDTMKIESSTNGTLSILQTGATRATGNADAQTAVDAVQKTASNSESSATVSLSTMRPSSDADIDMDKVESIKAALRDGTYTIDSGKIADGMLGTASDLLQTRANFTAKAQ